MALKSGDKVNWKDKVWNIVTILGESALLCEFTRGVEIEVVSVSELDPKWDLPKDGREDKWV